MSQVPEALCGGKYLYSTETNQGITEVWKHGIDYAFTASEDMLRRFADSDVDGDQTNLLYLIRIDVSRVGPLNQVVPEHYDPMKKISPENVEILFDGKRWRRLSSLSEEEVVMSKSKWSTKDEDELVADLMHEFSEHKCDATTSEFEGFLAFDGCSMVDGEGEKDKKRR